MVTCRDEAIPVYGTDYRIHVLRRIALNVTAPRLVVVSFLPNETAWEILRLCLRSIRRYTPEPHELWVVDNASPPVFAERLLHEPNLNVVLNLTRPMPKRTLKQVLLNKEPLYQGSYANAVALEIAASVIDPDSKMLMTLHMDTMACRCGWLSYLTGCLQAQVRCVGLRLDTKRVKTVHVLGLLFDFTLFRTLKLTFAHDMPRYDTGDAISIALENAGYSIKACRNSLWEPGLVESLPEDSPFKKIKVDRSFDDTNQVIFLHLGRGIVKSQGEIQEGKTSPDEWLAFGYNNVLKE